MGTLFVNGSLALGRARLDIQRVAEANAAWMRWYRSRLNRLPFNAKAKAGRRFIREAIARLGPTRLMLTEEDGGNGAVAHVVLPSRNGGPLELAMFTFSVTHDRECVGGYELRYLVLTEHALQRLHQRLGTLAWSLVRAELRAAIAIGLLVEPLTEMHCFKQFFVPTPHGALACVPEGGMLVAKTWLTDPLNARQARTSRCVSDSIAACLRAGYDLEVCRAELSKLAHSAGASELLARYEEREDPLERAWRSREDRRLALGAAC